MTENNNTAEFSTGRGIERLPDGRQRPLTASERAQVERTAALRDESLAAVEREVRKRG